jgi:hypothetical protein
LAIVPIIVISLKKTKKVTKINFKKVNKLKGQVGKKQKLVSVKLKEIFSNKYPNRKIKKIACGGAAVFILTSKTSKF